MKGGGFTVAPFFCIAVPVGAATIMPTVSKAERPNLNLLSHPFQICQSRAMTPRRFLHPAPRQSAHDTTMISLFKNAANLASLTSKIALKPHELLHLND